MMEGLGIARPGMRIRSARPPAVLEGSSWSPPTTKLSIGRPIRATVAASAERDCRISAATATAAAGDLRARLASGGGDEFSGKVGGGGFSHESEHDLAAMVSDFMENGSSGAESRYSSDSDSGRISGFGSLAERVTFYKHSMDRCESELSSAVHSLLLSIGESDLLAASGKDGQCRASCIRHLLAKLLRRSGYDAAVCVSSSQGDGGFFGGDHEYVDVLLDSSSDSETPERLIVDIDFQSQFEIARPVELYDSILGSLPMVYVGSLPRLEHFLRIMAEAAEASLKQNSMPLPPWRSLAYLQAKWHSKYQRIRRVRSSSSSAAASAHKQCMGHLGRLKASLLPDAEAADWLLNPSVVTSASDKKRRSKFERRRRPSLLSS